MPRQRRSRFTQANIPGERQQDLKKKAGQAREFHPLAGQDSEKMIASGWQTATPQVNDIEAVMVTDSACRQLLEGSFGVSDPYRPMYSAVERARMDRSAYISSEQAFACRQFEFRPLYTPVRTSVSQT